MADKDYLQKLADESTAKPASFQEEKVEYLQKEPFNFRKLILPLVFAVVAVIAVYLMFLAPRITMPDFIGQDKKDISAWARQESIETAKIVVKEEYNFENDEDVVIAQSIEAGTRIKNDQAITFTVSLGADPDELVSFPDIENMTYDEIKDWVAENKLSKVKTSTLYSNTVAEDDVIRYELKSVDESDFTRSSSLSVVISKGVAPAKTVKLEDLKGQTRAYVENYANDKKIVVNFVEAYDDDVAANMVISQSVAKNKEIKEGDSITVTVSKGKVVYMKDLVGMKSAEASLWLSNNGVHSNIGDENTFRYTNEHNGGTIISQSINKGRIVGDDAYLYLKESLGMMNLHDFAGPVYSSGSKTLAELQAWVYEKNHNGDAQMADPVVNEVSETDDCKAGSICKFTTEVGYIKVGTIIHVDVAVSVAAPIILEPSVLENAASLTAFLDANNISYSRTWEVDANADNGDIKSLTINGETPYKDDLKLGVNLDSEGVNQGGLSGYQLKENDEFQIVIVQNKEETVTETQADKEVVE